MARPPLWRDVRVLRMAFQIVVVAAVAAVLWYLWVNLVTNMRRQGLPTSFSFLDRPAGFRIFGTDFRSSDPVRDAIFVGLKNTVLVSVVGIALATLLGVLVGIARLSSNWLVRKAAALYVQSLRNIPLLVIIVFWSIAVILRLPRIDGALEWSGLLVLSNRGLWVPWPHGRPGLGAFLLLVTVAAAAALGVAWWRTRRFERTGAPHHRAAWALAVAVGGAVVAFLVLGRPVALSFPHRTGRSIVGGSALGPDYAALLVGLVLYTATHIAEVVRGSILAVPRGQADAAVALGLSAFDRLRYVVLPQAFRVAVPPLANQYLNLTKNSSLAIAVGYAELMTITQIVIGNANPAPQAIAILMACYLALSLAIAAATNLVNRRLQLAGGR